MKSGDTHPWAGDPLEFVAEWLLPRRSRLAALGRRIADRWTAIPWWFQVGIVWALGRVFTFIVFVIVADEQGVTPWSPDHPGYLQYINGWDAGYFQEIHDNGYPTTLPHDANGQVDNNPWAFLPLYPLLVRAITAPTGLSWLVVAPAVATIAALGFLLVAYRLFITRFAAGTSMAAIACLSFAPAAPVLQIPYSESLALFLLAAVLYLWTKERYLLSIPLLVLAGLTRPLAAPLALASVLLIGLTAWRQLRGNPVPRRTWLTLGATTVVSVLAIGLWPAIAAFVTGVPNAYLLTEAAWHAGEHQFPFKLFFRSMARFFGTVPGVLVGGVAILGLAWFSLSRAALRLGAVIWAWTISFIAYLVVVVPVNTSLIRLLAPAFPLALVVAGLSSSRAYRTLLLLSAAASQIAWIVVLWHWNGQATPAP